MGEALLSDMAAAFAIGAIPPGALMAAAVLSFLAIGTITFLIVRLTGRHTSSIGADGELLRAIALNSMAQGIVMFDAAERAAKVRNHTVEGKDIRAYLQEKYKL